MQEQMIERFPPLLHITQVIGHLKKSRYLHTLFNDDVINCQNIKESDEIFIEVILRS